MIGGSYIQGVGNFHKTDLVQLKKNKKRLNKTQARVVELAEKKRYPTPESLYKGLAAAYKKPSIAQQAVPDELRANPATVIASGQGNLRQQVDNAQPNRIPRAFQGVEVVDERDFDQAEQDRLQRAQQRGDHFNFADEEEPPQLQQQEQAPQPEPPQPQQQQEAPQLQQQEQAPQPEPPQPQQQQEQQLFGPAAAFDYVQRQMHDQQQQRFQPNRGPPNRQRPQRGVGIPAVNQGINEVVRFGAQWVQNLLRKIGNMVYYAGTFLLWCCGKRTLIAGAIFAWAAYRFGLDGFRRAIEWSKQKAEDTVQVTDEYGHSAAFFMQNAQSWTEHTVIRPFARMVGLDFTPMNGSNLTVTNIGPQNRTLRFIGDDMPGYSQLEQQFSSLPSHVKREALTGEQSTEVDKALTAVQQSDYTTVLRKNKVPFPEYYNALTVISRYERGFPIYTRDQYETATMIKASFEENTRATLGSIMSALTLDSILHKSGYLRLQQRFSALMDNTPELPKLPRRYTGSADQPREIDFTQLKENFLYATGLDWERALVNRLRKARQKRSEEPVEDSAVPQTTIAQLIEDSGGPVPRIHDQHGNLVDREWLKEYKKIRNAGKYKRGELPLDQPEVTVNDRIPADTPHPLNPAIFNTNTTALPQQSLPQQSQDNSAGQALLGLMIIGGFTGATFLRRLYNREPEDEPPTRNDIDEDIARMDVDQPTQQQQNDVDTQQQQDDVEEIEDEVEGLTDAQLQLLVDDPEIQRELEQQDNDMDQLQRRIDALEQELGY